MKKYPLEISHII